MNYSLRITLLSILFGLIVAPLSAHALEFAEVTIEQISPARYGQWVFLYPGGRLLSTNSGVDVKKYTARPRVGEATIIVRPPAGASVKIIMYKDGEIFFTTRNRRVSFEMENEDVYRIIVQYIFNVSGTLGITSAPSGLAFRMKGPDGRTRRGRTPKSFSNIPAGQYSIFIHMPGCVEPRPINRSVKAKKKTVVHVNLECNARKDNLTERRPVPSRRSFRNTVRRREALRANAHRARLRRGLTVQ